MNPPVLFTAPKLLLLVFTVLWGTISTGTCEELSSEEMLFFGTGVIEKSAPKPVAPPPAPTNDTSPAGGKVKLERSALKVILLDAPKKSFATAKLATFRAEANQAGARPQPTGTFSKGTPAFDNALLHGIASLRKKVPAWPAGLTVEYRCDGDYRAHEQDSAAVAAAVLLHSLVTGTELNPKAVLLGGIGPEAMGAVTGAVAIGTRLRTLENERGLRIGVPLVSEAEVRDLALMGEPETLLIHEVIAMVTLDDALAVAALAPPENFVKASAIFSQIQVASTNTPLPTLLKNTSTLAKLNEILLLVPQHLSARLLMQTATGKLPGKMTFLTSQQAILKAAQPFWETLMKHNVAEIRKISTSSANTLSLMQARVHPTVERYLIATRAFMRALNNQLEIRPGQQYDSMRRKAAEETRQLQEQVKQEKVKLDAAMKS
jgi:hypothetical protein